MIVNFYKSPVLLWRITVRFWRKRKRAGRVTKDKVYEVEAQNPFEAEARVTTKLLRSKRVARRFTKLKVVARTVVPDPTHPARLNDPPDDSLTEDWLKQEFATL